MSTTSIAKRATPPTPPTPLGLGLDAGGTQTRWALARPAGAIIAEGNVDGISALQLSSDAGRASINSVLAALATAVLATGKPTQVVAGISGFADEGERDHLAAMIASAVEIASDAVQISSDIDIAYRDAFAPGAGYLVYAGTGSNAAFIDSSNQFHRVGGHGGILDDGGSGVWIALEALRQIWRTEDECPGSWRESTMAREIFARIGGSDWAASRAFLYGGSFENNRGRIGQLALAVAATADTDPAARRILLAAGAELARLANTLVKRFGVRPIILSGRAAALHPLIAESMRAALPDSSKFSVRVGDAHHAAGRIAAGIAADIAAGKV